MSKVYISEKIFDKMLKAVGSGVSRVDIAHPEFTYIKLQVRGNEVTALSCDGYSGARMRFEAIGREGEDFDCIIKPIPFKVSKQDKFLIEIALEDKVATVEIPTVHGALLYKFRQSVEYKTDLDKIFDGMKAHDREIGVNSAMMTRIARSFANILTDRNKTIVIESKENNKQGFCIRAEEDGFSIEQFLMPVRLKERSERE